MRLALFLTGLLLSGLVFAQNDGLKSYLTDLQSLSAQFTQELEGENARVVETRHGKVSLKKPLRFRWEVLGEEPRVIVSDGKQIWDFDEVLEQVTVQPIDQENVSAPIFFLSGDLDSLDKDFIVQAIDSKSCQSEACFKLVPKDEQGSFQWIQIGFVNRRLNSMRVLDQLGQISRFSFEDVVMNQPLSDELFHFNPPKNIDILMSN